MALWWFWVLIGAVVVLALIFFAYYNRFVKLINQISNALAQIDVQLKKRADLVPNLLESVKGYMKHERGVITEVTNARKALVGAGNIQTKIKAGAQLESALGRLFAIAENYPNLKANENFLQFQNELSAIENKIAYARQYYNDGVMSYNISTTTVPGKWFASLYGFKDRKYIEITEEEKAVPKVKF
ncbi:MAG: LemA family protein [Nanoarchaeota archaeon]|nr:LemA family protein [Nanoarchaeota archaeon]